MPAATPNKPNAARPAALVRGDDGNLHVRHFTTPAEATAASRDRELPTAPARFRRTLRPADIAATYGIPPGTLHFYCEDLPEADRLPSIKLPGRKPKLATNKTKGVRMVFVDDLEQWLARWRTPKGKASA